MAVTINNSCIMKNYSKQNERGKISSQIDDIIFIMFSDTFVEILRKQSFDWIYLVQSIFQIECKLYKNYIIRFYVNFFYVSFILFEIFLQHIFSIIFKKVCENFIYLLHFFSTKTTCKQYAIVYAWQHVNLPFSSIVQ